MDGESNLLGFSKKYGVWGDGAIQEWKSDYERIRKEVKFGGADDDAYLRLMKKISDRMDKEIKRGNRWNILGIIMVLVCIAMLYLFSQTGGGHGLWFGAVAVTVALFMMKRCCNKVLMAAVDFDEVYFDGEILYRRKNG